MEIFDSLKKYAEDENPIIATVITMIGNIFPMTPFVKLGLLIFYIPNHLHWKRFFALIMGKRKDGKHARFADQKAARRKANKKS